MKEKQSLSIASEIEELANALDGARLLISYLDTEQLASNEDVLRVPRLATALLNLTYERLIALCSIVRGNMDPVRLLAPHNTAIDDDDVVIKPWSRKEGNCRKP